MYRTKSILIVHALSTICALASGCAADEMKPEANDQQPPDLESKAAQSFRNPVEHGKIAFGDPAVAKLSGSEGFHAWDVELSGQAFLSVTTGPAGRGDYEVDTVAYVYRRQEGGSWGRHIARNDDKANSLWSKIDESFGEGTYRILVKGYKSGVRGKFALNVNCEGAGCLPKPEVDSGACHAAIQDFLRACALSEMESEVGQGHRLSLDDALERCASAEPAAPHYDRLCASADKPAFCDESLEEFERSTLQTCRWQVQEAVRSTSCVFGERFQPLREGLVRGLITVATSEISPTNVTALSSLAGRQLVLAVKASAHDDVSTPVEAITRPDGKTVYVYELWDATARRSFTAYEFGAGDNSFGLIFAHGTTDVAARINDGDFYECVAKPGPEMKECAVDSHCAKGLVCEGVTEAIGKGVCLDPGAPRHPDEGVTCGSSPNLGCPLDSGLWCSLPPEGSDGICHQAWQQARFEVRPQLAVPDNNPKGAEAQIAVYGLATVDTDVAVQAWIGHPRTTDLVVTLVNPAGTERVIWDGPAAPASARGTHLEIDTPVRFSGDESVNGVWILRVADVRRGSTGGVLSHFRLFVASRWD